MPDDFNPTYEELQEIAARLQQGEVNPELTAKLLALHPADWADVVEELEPEQSIALLRTLTLEQQADIIEYIEDEETAAIAEQMPLQEMAVILDEMSPDDAADLLGDINPLLAEALLAEMEEEGAVRPLLLYPDDTAGGLMVPITFRLKQFDTVAIALDKLRTNSPDPELIYYLFVEDKQERLVGVVSLRRLVVATPDTEVAAIMDDEVRYVPALTDQEECARLLQRYGLLALPVVDEAMRLMGIITVDDLVDVVAEEAEEDTFLLSGQSAEAMVFDSTRGAIRKRLPWLFVNLMTASLAATVVLFFDETIARFASLAALLGIVAGLGGNAGTQTLTLMVRGLATQQLSFRDAMELLRREGVVAMLQGAAIGLTAALVSYLVLGEPLTSLVFGIALLGNMMLANTMGVLIPLLLERVGVDPAVASSIFVTACTDLFGFGLLLGLATLLFG